jgi:hypothetical protein
MGERERLHTPGRSTLIWAKNGCNHIVANFLPKFALAGIRIAQPHGRPTSTAMTLMI